MFADYQLDLYEVRQILEQHLKKKTGVAAGDIAICSYGQPKMLFRADGLVTSIEMRHWIRRPE